MKTEKNRKKPSKPTATETSLCCLFGKSHTGYQSWLLCPLGPIVSFFSEISTTLQFPSYLSPSVCPSCFDMGETNEIFHNLSFTFQLSPETCHSPLQRVPCNSASSLHGEVAKQLSTQLVGHSWLKEHI